MLVNHLWQATLFSLLAYTATTLLRPAPASARYYVWLIALIKFALPSAFLIFLIDWAGVNAPALTNSVVEPSPIVSAVSPILSPMRPPLAALQAAEQTSEGAKSFAVAYATPARGASNLYAALTCVWLTGCVLLFAFWWRRRRQLSATLRAGRVLEGGREVEALRRVQKWLGHRRQIRLMVTPAVSGPGVWYVWRPVIVMPEGIADQMDDGELEAVLMHEMSHVERRDNLAGNLQRFLCCVLWFHPLIWLIDRRLLSEREQACDDMVIRLGGAPSAYASSIAKVCRHCVGWNVAGLSKFAGSDLKKRIERIVSNRAGGKLSTPQSMIVAGTAALALSLSIAAGQFTGGDIVARSKNDPGAEPGVVTDARFEVGLSAQHQGPTGTVSQVREVAPRHDARVASSGISGQIRMATEDPGEVSAGGRPVEGSSIAFNEVPIQPRAVPPPETPPDRPSDTLQAVMVKASDVEYGDLRRFMGRYEVDPARAENFVLDVTLEDGELWLKPSHAQKRRLIRQSDTKFSDSFGEFRFTSILDDQGRVVVLRLDSWGRNVIARKLALPKPSLTGSTTFRLKGHVNARVVAVAGTFNKWNQSQFLFARQGDGWECRVNLPPGTHQYKFIVDGNWLTDPSNPKMVHDERGFLNSLLTAE